MATLSTYFEQDFAHLKFDARLADKFRQYRIDFENKNEDHMTFFGGNLTGVQIVRFTQQDRNAWFTDLLSTNETEVEQRVHSLPSINAAWHISSDLMNLSCLWFMHKFLNSPLLKDEQKEAVLIDLAMTLNYKFLTGLHSHYFRFPADPEIAAATYAQMSLKFTIKQYGSWRATIKARTDDLCAKDGIHYNVIKHFKQDASVVNALNDTQNRIRSMLKNIMAETLKVKAHGVRIQRTTATTLDIDGEEMLKDKQKSLLGYVRYMHSIVTDKDTFVKQELIDIVANAMHTMPPKQLQDCLFWMSDNYAYDKKKLAEKTIDAVLKHAFGYLSSNTYVVSRTQDLSDFIAKIRGVYMSSRSTDIELIEIRDLSEQLVRAATTTKNESLISSIKTGVMLYICLRAFTKRHYGG